MTGAQVAQPGLDVGAEHRVGANVVVYLISAGAPGPPAHRDELRLDVSALGAKLEEGRVRRGRGLAVMPLLWPGASPAAAVAL